MASPSKQQISYTSTTAQVGPSKAAGSCGGTSSRNNNNNDMMLSSAWTPQGSRPPITVVAPGAPPTPTDYEIVTESCDWCLAETPWDDGDLFGHNENLDELVVTTQSTPPNSKQESPPQVNLQPRQALGIPMM